MRSAQARLLLFAAGRTPSGSWLYPGHQEKPGHLRLPPPGFNKPSKFCENQSMPGRSSKARTPEAIAAHSKRLSDLRTANQRRREKDQPGALSPNEAKSPQASGPGKLGGAKGFVR
jgi:hypothetical protein